MNGQGQVNVTMQSVIDQLHQRYGRLLAGTLQENSEQAAALDALGQENAELRSRLDAMSSPSNPVQGTRYGGRDVPADAAPIDADPRDAGPY